MALGDNINKAAEKVSAIPVIKAARVRDGKRTLYPSPGSFSHSVMRYAEFLYPVFEPTL